MSGNALPKIAHTLGRAKFRPRKAINSRGPPAFRRVQNKTLSPPGRDYA